MILILRCDTCNARYSNRPVFAIEKRGCCIFLIAEQVLTLSLSHFISLYLTLYWKICRLPMQWRMWCVRSHRATLSSNCSTWKVMLLLSFLRSLTISGRWRRYHADNFLSVCQNIKTNNDDDKLYDTNNEENNDIHENVPGVSWRGTSLPSLSLLSSPRTACPWLACSLFSTASFQFLKPMYFFTFLFSGGWVQLRHSQGDLPRQLQEPSPYVPLQSGAHDHICWWWWQSRSSVLIDLIFPGCQVWIRSPWCQEGKCNFQSGEGSSKI